MAKGLRDVLDLILVAWGLAGITYLVLTHQVSGIAALPLFGIGAGLTTVPAILSAKKAGKEAEKVGSG